MHVHVEGHRLAIIAPSGSLQSCQGKRSTNKLHRGSTFHVAHPIERPSAAPSNSVRGLARAPRGASLPTITSVQTSGAIQQLNKGTQRESIGRGSNRPWVGDNENRGCYPPASIARQPCFRWLH